MQKHNKFYAKYLQYMIYKVQLMVNIRIQCQYILTFEKEVFLPWE